MPEILDYMELVNLGITSGLITGIIVSFASWSLRMVFNTIRMYFY